LFSLSVEYRLTFRVFSLQLVHRDVKLENVILTSEDLDQASVKLVDFGLAAFIKVVGDSKYQKM